MKLEVRGRMDCPIRPSIHGLAATDWAPSPWQTGLWLLSRRERGAIVGYFRAFDL